MDILLSESCIDFKDVLVPKIKSLKKKFFYNFKTGNFIIGRVLWKKNIIFYEKNLKLSKNNTFNNVFCNRIFTYYPFLPIFWKWFDFDKLWLIFSGNIFSLTLLSLILEIKKKIFKHGYLKKMLSSKNSFNDFSYLKHHF